jgi:thiosulfate/3-mercaptopyruvate sulfurtransferase
MPMKYTNQNAYKSQSENAMNSIYTTLITAQDAYSHLQDPNWRFLDCHFDLMDPQAGRRQYQAAHIPGALFVDMENELSASITPETGRHPLPTVKDLEETIARWGISAAQQVVVYDARGGVAASRLWWILHWLGFDAVAVLDGGLQHWQALGYPTTTEVPTVKAARFCGKLDFDALIRVNEIVTAQQQGSVLLDARSPERYRGDMEPIDPVAGHIPGARNYFQMNNLQDNGLFKSKEELRQQFVSAIGTTLPQKIIHYCGSGVSACHNLLAMEHIGLSGSKLYAGSWSEWIRDPSRAVATGNEK